MFSLWLFLLASKQIVFIAIVYRRAFKLAKGWMFARLCFGGEASGSIGIKNDMSFILDFERIG